MLKNGQGVYTNVHACELTLQMIEQYPTWVIPEMNRLLVESATHPDQLEQLNKQPAWSSYWNTCYGAELAELSAASRVTLSVDIPFSDERALFPTDEERIRTRLGAEGVKIDLPEEIVGPFGEPISSFTLPPQWQTDPDAPVEANRLDDRLTISNGQHHFQYGPRGLEKLKQ